MLSLPERGDDAFPRQQRPDAGNLADLCRSLGPREVPLSLSPGAGDQTPTRTRARPDSSLRLEAATQAMEAALTECCRQSQLHTRLTCSLEAWERSLLEFCEEELSVKTVPHKCCQQTGERRWECFTWAAHSQPNTTSTAEGDATGDGATTVVDPPFPGRWTQEEMASLPPRARDADRVLTMAFPRQRPDAGNVGDLCRYVGQRDPHPLGTLPRTGFTHLRQLLAATVAMETGFNGCCSDPQSFNQLQCNQDVWTRSLDDLCAGGESGATSPHLCCRMPESKRHDCFSWAAPAQSYLPPAHGPAEVPDFTHADFPPGRPSPENIDNICRGRHQPLTITPVSELVELTPGQLTAARLRTQLAGHYRSCCSGENRLQCAKDKWSELVTQFCTEPVEAMDASSPCCLKVGEERDDCLASRTTFPNYDHEVHVLNLSALSEWKMDILCRAHTELIDEGPQSLLVKVLQRCCSRQNDQEKLACGVNKLEKFANRACNQDSSQWNDALSCCSQDTQNCFNTHYLAQVKVYLQVA
ncbi:extracellular matrix protein 1-like [Leucoraja erinacea]|uniref:extracellular matrix protein 1-like n=1 Tax=Leucoraja erinaceus TaxID=7782 RepID=UPI002454DC13|nr:extracellular matrix protein 1-like [Leucoraja erinacea]